MTTLKIISEKPIDISELKDSLDAIKKRDKELGFRANKTIDYINHFAGKKSKKDLIKKLEDLKIPRLKDLYIVKITDFLPTTVDALKMILQGYPVTVNNDNLKKIVKVVQDFEGK